MKNLSSILFLLLVLVTTVPAQTTTAKVEAIPSSPKEDRLNEDEQLIRSAYEKLMRYHKATVLYDFAGSEDELPARELLQFSLKNFHAGPMEELADLPFQELMPATGPIIDVMNGKHSLDGGPFEASYLASWARHEKEARLIGLNFKAGDVFKMFPGEVFDIGRYISYEVTVTLHERTRTYKAFVYVHNLHDSAATPWHQFADSVTGNGAVGDASRETNPPLTGKSTRASLEIARKRKSNF